MIRFKFFIYFIYIVLFLELITDAISLLRLTQIFNTSLITRFFIIIPLLFISLVMLINLSKVKLNLISIFVLFMMLYGVLLSTFYWQNNNSFNYSGYYLTTEFISIFSALSAFLYVYNINFKKKDATKIIEKTLDFFSIIILIIATINVLLGYILNYFTSYTSYLSISGKFLLIPCGWFLLNSKHGNYLFTTFIILLGGKIGVLISSILMTVFIVKYKYKIKSLYFFIFFIFSILFLFLSLYIIKDINGIGVIDKINGNYNIFNLDINNIIGFGGGRLIEVFSVFNDYTYANYLFGKGIGFEYLDITDSLNYIHNVHITPLGLVSKFGLLFTLGIYIFIIYILFKKKNNNIITVFFKSIVIGMLIFSLTEYSFFVNLILWISLGYLSNISKEKLCVV